MTTEETLPPLPEKSYLGDDASYGFDEFDMRDYALAALTLVQQERDELRAALIWREQFEPRQGEGSNERFERIAEVFHRETGYLRPGKDCRVESNEVRQEAWDAWMEAGRARCRAALTPKATQPTSEASRGR